MDEKKLEESIELSIDIYNKLDDVIGDFAEATNDKLETRGVAILVALAKIIRKLSEVAEAPIDSIFSDMKTYLDMEKAVEGKENGNSN